MKAATETGGTSARQVSAKGPPAGLVQSYSAHGHEVLDIAVTSDNARFASVGGDRQVFLWDVAQGRTLKRWAGHAGRVNAVDFGGEGSVVVSGEHGMISRLRLQPLIKCHMIVKLADNSKGVMTLLFGFGTVSLNQQSLFRFSTKPRTALVVSMFRDTKSQQVALMDGFVFTIYAWV